MRIPDSLVGCLSLMLSMDAIDRKMLGAVIAKTQVLDDCWIYGQNVGRHAYAQFRIDGEYRSVHRSMFELLVGPIPDGFVVNHKCERGGCWRPDHLEAVTQQANVRYAFRHLDDVCPKGHRRTEKNTYWRLTPSTTRYGKKYMRRTRMCRDCEAKKARDYRADRKSSDAYSG